MPSVTTLAPCSQDRHFEAAALRHWEEDQYKFPPGVYYWDSGLARSGVWRRQRFAAIFGKQCRLGGTYSV